MGITLIEVLHSPFFQDFQVLAGQDNLSREVQGITILDAPDGCNWMKGKELVLTSGYIFDREPEAFLAALDSGALDQMAGFIIKRNRYMHPIPKDLVARFETRGLPLISMPFEISYMELMYRVNLLVLNRAFGRFKIKTTSDRLDGRSYREQKILKILAAVENEMGFPAYLYDFGEEKGYQTSPRFLSLSEHYGLTLQDFWAHDDMVTSQTLCDSIGLVRHRLTDYSDPDGAKISWLTIPIRVAGVEAATLIVMESKEFIDYYDEYSLRIAYVMLQEVYEQMAFRIKSESIGFEQFLLYARTQERFDHRLNYLASLQGLAQNTPCTFALFHADESHIRDKRTQVIDLLRKSLLALRHKVAFLDEDTGLIMFYGDTQSLATIKKALAHWLKHFENEENVRVQLVIGHKDVPLESLATQTSLLERAIHMRPANDGILTLDEFGPLLYFSIPKEAEEELLSRFKQIKEENPDLLTTLRYFLNHNMNYSQTAKQMYVQVNTIKNRIAKLKDLYAISLDNPMERLNYQLLLTMLHDEH